MDHYLIDWGTRRIRDVETHLYVRLRTRAQSSRQHLPARRGAALDLDAYESRKATERSGIEIEVYTA